MLRGRVLVLVGLTVVSGFRVVGFKVSSVNQTVFVVFRVNSACVSEN